MLRCGLGEAKESALRAAQHATSRGWVLPKRSSANVEMVNG